MGAREAADAALEYTRTLASDVYEVERDYDERGHMIKARRRVEGRLMALGFITGLNGDENETLARALDQSMRQPEAWLEYRNAS